ncbi:NAD(P)-binding protein [Choiromyces venosus 120613-1]|uniref:NAD(P)-binding protein n=1 Tax=Choiromyces venosus 120613-1 TaxID=1336337 RepID=A0A3N4JMW0_9PEZI|nr:NAD(P)-binding protein [Choiromyces venosus 120613-1]
MSRAANPGPRNVIDSAMTDPSQEPAPNPTPVKELVVVNATGRQASSVVRVASAVGYKVRAQLRSLKKDLQLSAELKLLPNVTLLEGSLDDQAFVDTLFVGAQYAFVNTTPYAWTDEVATGKSLALAAHKAGIRHYIFSSLTDHSTHDPPQDPLPLWATKFTVEQYIRQLGLPATFVYVGSYHNNFSSRPYPLWQLTPRADGGFVWKAPFPPDYPIPFVDTEHDLGAAVIQIFKDGVQRWGGQRIPLAFEVLTPLQVCSAFSRALGRPVNYQPHPLEIHIPIPPGYRDQLEGIVKVLCEQRAPYFRPEMEDSATTISRALWPGWRGMEEYAREVWPIEEKSNGASWIASGVATPASEMDGEN